MRRLFLAVSTAMFLAGCSSAPVATEKAASKVEAPKPGGYRIYVTNEISGDLSVIDSGSLEVIATVPLGKRPRGIHASPDHRTLYVALSGSPPAGPGVDESTLPPPDKSADGIGVFDVAQNKLARVLKGGSDPENFDVSLDGKTLYVSNEDASGVSYVDVDTGAVTKTIKTGEEPEGVKMTPDGNQFYATSEEEGTVSVVDIAAGKKIASIKVGRRPRTIAFMPDGTRAYVNAENDGAVVLVDTVKKKMIKAIPVGEAATTKPMMVLLSADASKLYVSGGRAHKVFILDTATNQVTGSIEVGKRPWGIALSPDGKTLFSANGPSNDISVVDLATQTVTKTIKSGGSPWGVLTLAN